MLCPQDILPHAAYSRVRPDYLRWMVELKRHRRCRLSPTVSILFENRETVLHQIHEVLHAEGHSPERIEVELSLYECLIPPPGELRATVMVDGGSRDRGRETVAALRRPGGVRLGSGDLSCGSALAVQGDRAIDDAVQYLRFRPSAQLSSRLQRRNASAHLSFDDECSLTTIVSESLRAQLAQDLYRISCPSTLHALASQPRGPRFPKLRATWPL